MLFKFNKNVEFIFQDAKCAQFLINNETIYHQLNSDLNFEYSVFNNGYSTEKTPEHVSQFLITNGLVEKIDDEIVIEPKFNFLKNVVSNQDQANQLIQNIKNVQIFVLNLSQNFIQLAELETTTNLSYIDDINLFDQKQMISENSFLLVLVDSQELSKISVVNLFCLHNKVPWLLVCLNNHGLQIGPYFSHSPTRFCYYCYRNKPRNLDHKKNLCESRDPAWSSLDLKARMEINFLQFELISSVAQNFRKYESSVKLFDPLRQTLLVKQFLPFPICTLCRS